MHANFQPASPVCMHTFNLPSQVCRQTFNPPRKFECKLAPPFACKCLHACPRAQICLQTFSPASRVFAQTFNPASQVCAQTFNLPAQVCIQTFNLVAQACMQTCSPASQVWNHFLKRICKGKSSPKWRKMLPKHHSQLIMLPWQCDLRRFTILSCKTKKYFARSRSSEEPWRSHSTVICRDWDAKRNRIIRTSATQIAAPKQDLDAQAEERRVWSTL